MTTRRAAALVVTAAVVVMGALAGWWLVTVAGPVRPAHAVTVPVPSRSPAVRCQEDAPCWDCRTMGNRVCGPTTPPVTE